MQSGYSYLILELSVVRNVRVCQIPLFLFFFLFLCFVNTLSTLHQLIHCNFFHFCSLDNIVECILPPDYADSTMHVVVVWLFFLVLRRIG